MLEPAQIDRPRLLALLGAPTRCALAATLLAVLLAPVAAAQAPKPPGLGYVYPPAIPAGQGTSVQLGGFDFTLDMQWFVHDDQVQLELRGEPGDYHLPPPPYWLGPRASTAALPIPREVPGHLTVAASVPAGLVRWQVANANGASATAAFYVSRGQEIIEARLRDQVQRLPALPVAVSGRLSRLTEVDRYELVAEQDGPISVDLMARRFGSDFLAVLQVHDAAGELLADFADTQGLDGGVTFSAKANARYTISLHDVDFRGDRAYVYRLAVSRGPRVLCTIPAAGQRGTTRDVEFVGVGVATAAPAIESVRQAVAFPADKSMLSHTHSLQTAFGTVEVSIPLSDMSELAADSEIESAPLAAPVAVTGALPLNAHERRHRWQVDKDEFWSIELQSRAIGGTLDVALAVLDPEGKLVGESDDLPGSPDAALEFRAGTSGIYTCAVRSVSTRVGSPAELYRLQMVRSAPGFSLSVPQQISLPLGGKTAVAVKAVRTGGYAGEIALSVDGLPPGVTAQGDWKIPAGKNELSVTLESAADAAVAARAIRFRGTGTIGDTTFSCSAAAVAAGNRCPRTAREQQTEAVLLAMTMPAPFELKLLDRNRQREVRRGTTYRAEFEIVRKDGFDGEIQLHMSAQQARNRQGIRGPIIRVSPGMTRALYPCFMPEWLGTDLTRRMEVHGVAAVPDPKGSVRYLTRSADARITMIMEGALMKLACEAKEPTVQIGGSFELPVHVARSPELPIATTVELIVPPDVAGLLSAEPLVLPPGQDRGVLRIATQPDSRLVGHWPVQLKATSLEDGQWPVISETDVPVMFMDRSGP